jgi:hypothetical protein
MTTSPLSRAGLAALVIAFAPLARAADPAPQFAELGDHTYRVTVSASHKFTRNTDKLKAEASAAAADYCARLGKQLKIVGVKENKSLFLVGDMASATLTFKALDLADPELAKPAAPASAVEAVAAPRTNEAMYADLLRLDDLHKKGILSDAEFAAEKKKVLDRSP